MRPQGLIFFPVPIPIQTTQCNNIRPTRNHVRCLPRLWGYCKVMCVEFVPWLMSFWDHLSTAQWNNGDGNEKEPWHEAPVGWFWGNGILKLANSFRIVPMVNLFGNSRHIRTLTIKHAMGLWQWWGTKCMLYDWNIFLWCSGCLSVLGVEMQSNRMTWITLCGTFPSIF